MKKKVVVGMSGGVDSSVAAYLLKEQGYDVIGVTMQIWQDEDVFKQSQEGGCCGLSAVEDARRVAAVLDIPYYVMNFKADFKKYVIDYFVSEYERAYTPNPCIACNRYVKWGVAASPLARDRSRLYSNRPLCPHSTASKRQIHHSQLSHSGKGPDICALQSDTGAATSHADACGRV